MSSMSSAAAPTAGIKRAANFNPGPSAIPLEVLQQAQTELLDYRGTGMSVMEISHRSPEYDDINNGAMALVRELMGIGEEYRVIFLGGGASLQFAMVPMNFLAKDKTAAYVDTGSWANKAAKEAKLFGTVQIAASTKEENYRRIPKLAELKYATDVAYLHITSNNTIYGSQWQWWPQPGNVPLVCDMSSDLFSRRVDFKSFSLIYAGAQKNLGPAGVTLVVIHEKFLEKANAGLPVMLSYKTHVDKLSLYNTPPVFAVYMMKLTMDWIKRQGGLAAVEKTNMAKKERIYQMVDLYPNFYRGTVDPDSRSWMNLTLRLPSEDLEKKFLSEAKAAGMVGLKGHRDVGGIRVSLYNAVPLAAADKLAEFMEQFHKKNV